MRKTRKSRKLFINVCRRSCLIRRRRRSIVWSWMCFNQCRALRREGMKIEVMRPDEYCNNTTTTNHPQLQKKMFHRGHRWL
ncbi:hypothetical protein CRE_22888 [Caenorhabditis remanei]|uniref:Uncharacterized protein n=1 Tax=Caenorhabditis remanei TaxID=31234 RepID=E3MHD8_CAERE|nr:hypothetical protein CRE_22888 [Caenorhabditis remanei]